MRYLISHLLIYSINKEGTRGAVEGIQEEEGKVKWSKYL